MNKSLCLLVSGVITFFSALLLSILFSLPSYAHAEDLTVAEITVTETQAAVTLTFPTFLVSALDDDRSGQLSTPEIRQHDNALVAYLSDRFVLSDRQGRTGNITVQSANNPSLPPHTNTTLHLNYTWSQPLQRLNIDYGLFTPETPSAHCLATIRHAGQSQSILLSTTDRNFSLTLNSQDPTDLLHRGGLLAIAAAFVWGGTHALSPGHGKTLLGAYLVGTKATSRHALLLGLTVTLTHTIGVFAMGLIALFASRYILPEQLYPWLSLTSGIAVGAIGLNLAIQRGRREKHHHHHHSHSDTEVLATDNTSVTWKNLIAVGISGGLVPCPAALVLLLSAIAWGQISFGLALVIFFSMGLAITLTSLGLLLVNAKQQFEKLPGMPRFLERLPVLSAVTISIVGLGICLKAAIQIEGF